MITVINERVKSAGTRAQKYGTTVIVENVPLESVRRVSIKTTVQ